MPHPLFDERPWSDRPVSLPDDLVGMLGLHEASLFHDLAKGYFSGGGAIVDAGSFLGKSGYCFAQGLLANPKFDKARDRVHCFDDFVCHDQHTVDFIVRGFGERIAVGSSTRSYFDRQVQSVGDLLEVHAGDLHTIEWQRQPIEILMIDVAKTESLGRRCVELFFRDLLPGTSLVIHQDYHHPWLPHIHVVMEYLADYFELVAPRVDYSAAFLLTKEIPESMLARAIAYDFSPDEQLNLMDGALARLAEQDRHFVALARLALLQGLGKPESLCAEFAAVERRYAAAASDENWQRDLEKSRNFVEFIEAQHSLAQGNFDRAIELADALIARQANLQDAYPLRANALLGSGRRDEAVAAAEASCRLPLARGQGRLALARILCELHRADDAEALLLADLLDPALAVAQRRAVCDALCSIWQTRRRPEREDEVVAQLRRELPGEPEIELLAARSAFLRGDQQQALGCVRTALASKATWPRCAELLQPLGLTPEAVLAMEP